MVALNFTVFQDKILDGRKCQTIRRAARCKPGDRLQLYTGMRTKACRKLGEAVCSGVETIRIGGDAGSGFIAIDNCPVFTRGALHGFAAADGFNSPEAFFAFFEQHYGLPFEGVVISWSDFQPAEES